MTAIGFEPQETLAEGTSPQNDKTRLNQELSSLEVQAQNQQELMMFENEMTSFMNTFEKKENQKKELINKLMQLSKDYKQKEQNISRQIRDYNKWKLNQFKKIEEIKTKLENLDAGKDNGA